MQMNEPFSPGELLRQAMRCWASGVAVVTSTFGGISHGMTVNSFGSVSLDPPLVTVTMNNNTRTYALVERSGIFGVTILSHLQQSLAELFAGRVAEGQDRMAGLETFTMVTGAPLLAGGIAFVDCRVVHRHVMNHSTLFVAEAVAARTTGEPLSPLVYFNRTFTGLEV